jgi:hypothetical protein
MSKSTQRAAVYGAITHVLETTEFEGAVTLTSDQREMVMQMLCEGFKSGEIEFADTPSNHEKLQSDSKLKNYVGGLVSNWLRKDDRLNGGVKYVPKNPGSRTGQGDDQLKTLRALKAQFEIADPSKVPAVEKAINDRVAQIQAEKASAKFAEIDFSKLPADLIAKLGIESK